MHKRYVPSRVFHECAGDVSKLPDGFSLRFDAARLPADWYVLLVSALESSLTGPIRSVSGRFQGQRSVDVYCINALSLPASRASSKTSRGEHLGGYIMTTVLTQIPDAG